MFDRAAVFLFELAVESAHRLCWEWVFAAHVHPLVVHAQAGRFEVAADDHHVRHCRPRCLLFFSAPRNAHRLRQQVDVTQTRRAILCLQPIYLYTVIRVKIIVGNLVEDGRRVAAADHFQVWLVAVLERHPFVPVVVIVESALVGENLDVASEVALAC